MWGMLLRLYTSVGSYYTYGIVTLVVSLLKPFLVISGRLWTSAVFPLQCHVDNILRSMHILSQDS